MQADDSIDGQIRIQDTAVYLIEPVKIIECINRDSDQKDQQDAEAQHELTHDAKTIEGGNGPCHQSVKTPAERFYEIPVFSHKLTTCQRDKAVPGYGYTNLGFSSAKTG